MEVPNTNVLHNSLQQQLKNVDFAFTALNEKALERIKNSNHNLESIPIALTFIQDQIHHFLEITQNVSNTSFDIVGLDSVKEAYCDFTCARQLLDHHLNNNNNNNQIDNDINLIYIKDLKQLDKILNDNLWYFKTIKDYIAKSVRISFQSNIESRFNSLLNGNNQVIEKSKLIENTTFSPAAVTSPSVSSKNINIPNLKPPIHPPVIPTRPRTLSPSPTPSNDSDSNLLDLYSKKVFIDLDDLMEIYNKFDKNVLLIDFRPNRIFNIDHISLFTNIVNIDPISVKPSFIFQDVIDHSLLLSSFRDLEAFVNISKFDLIIIIDQSSIHAKISQNTLRFYSILDEKNNDLKYKLKRKPLILDGGFDEWTYFMNNQSQPKSQNEQILNPIIHNPIPISVNNSNISNYQQNYIHTQPFISRSPSPIGLYNNNNNNYFSSNFIDKPTLLFPVNTTSNRTKSPSPLPVPLVLNPSIKSNIQYNNSGTSASPPKISNVPVLKVSSMNTPIRSTSPNKSPIIISGLYNLGNSCYMNSVLQCLIGTKELTNYLLQDLYQKFVAINSKLGSRGKLTNEYQKLAKLMLSNTIKHIATNPRDFKKVVGEINLTFKNCDQQDSAEFLHFLLDTIHEDLNWSANRESLPAISNEDEANREILPIRLASTIEWERYLKTDYSSIIEIFAGQYASRLRCCICENTSTTYIPFNMLSIPIPNLKNKELNLYDCINSFVSPEILIGDNAWKCSKCKENIKTEKQLTITRLPNILIIHLERFSFIGDNLVNGKFVKNSSKINIPLNLSMGKYWPKIQDEQEKQQLQKLPLRGQEGEWEYELYGVIRHYGTLDGGHYISEVKKNGAWIKFDDDKVKVDENMGKIPESDGSAYILFFEKVH